MNPPPDDAHEAEPPMTRAFHPTDVDDGTRAQGVDPEGTLDEETRKLAASVGLSGFGSDPGPGASTGATTARGVSGRIEPGQVLYSKYQVIRKLGGGAMGDVWLVNHASLKNLHALKLIVSNIATNEVVLRRFQREFEVMASLEHPHAVRIYDACIDDDGGYIDMEFVQGQTLHDILSAARKRPELDPSSPLMPLDWIVRILDQLTEVLQEAHEKGIVHRDLKPSNLMLLDGRKPGKEYLKVLDFGIAKIRDDPDNAANMTLTQGFIGTPSYGSPEQALNRDDIDGRSDVYSVGVILYEFVTGRLPFKGVQFQVMHQHASVPPPPFSGANPELRPVPELERVILRALAKERDRRPQTARDLFDEFRKAVEDHLGPAAVGLTPQTWEVFRPPGGPPAVPDTSTEHDGALAHAAYATQPDTLAIVGPERGPTRLHAKPDARPDPEPGWRTGKPTDREDGGRTTGWGPVAAATAAMLLLGLFVGAAIFTFAIPPKSDGGQGGEIRKALARIHLPDGYAPMGGEPSPGAYPERVRREADNAEFVRFSDGIYLPEGYSPVGKADLVDGWPRVIARDADSTHARFRRIWGDKEWTMGNWSALPNADQDDAPAHPVSLRSGFYIQETEVTNGQFEEFLKDTSRAKPAAWEEAYLEKKKESRELAASHPAVSVSYEMALEFASYFGAMLPTEAQWEFAARSRGLQHKYAWGDRPRPDRQHARIDTENALTTAPVGSYPKDVTAEGLLDMAGNVQEMCRDVWKKYRKPSGVLRDPCETADDSGEIKYAVRGGSFASLPDRSSTTARGDVVGLRQYEPTIGFRLVVECPDARPPKP